MSPYMPSPNQEEKVPLEDQIKTAIRDLRDIPSLHSMEFRVDDKYNSVTITKTNSPYLVDLEFVTDKGIFTMTTSDLDAKVIIPFILERCNTSK